MKNSSLDTITAQLFNDILTGKKPVSELHFLSFWAKRRWKRIFSEYVSEFGLSQNYIEHLRKKVQASNFEAKATKQKAYKARAKLLWHEADKMLQMQGDPQPFGVTVAMVSKFMGYPINPNKISAKEFYNYVRLANNGE